MPTPQEFGEALKDMTDAIAKALAHLKSSDDQTIRRAGESMEKRWRAELSSKVSGTALKPNDDFEMRRYLRELTQHLDRLNKTMGGRPASTPRPPRSATGGTQV